MKDYPAADSEDAQAEQRDASVYGASVVRA